MNAAPRLCIFARSPVVDQVKRRLAAEIGAASALAAHQQLVEDSLDRLAVVPGIVSELWLAGPGNQQVRQWLERYPLILRRQRGADLGARMLHALRSSAAAGVAGLVVGTDCPAIDRDYIAEAADRLRTADVVLGPAEDGGYGLIGANAAILARAAPLFDDMPWGSDRVFATTVDRAARAGLRTACLATIWDVDTAADWRRYLALRQVP